MQKNQKTCPATAKDSKKETCPSLPAIVIQAAGQAGVPGH